MSGNLSNFKGGYASGVRGGKREISRQVADMRRHEKPLRKRCLCNAEDCHLNCVIGLECWKTAPGQAKRDIYSRCIETKRSAARALCEHALSRNPNRKPEQRKLAL